jgi:hypothetical protein
LQFGKGEWRLKEEEFNCVTETNGTRMFARNYRQGFLRTFENQKHTDKEVVMKRSAVSRQRNASALAPRGAGNTGVIGLLLLSLLLFNAPVARARQQIVPTGGATWNTMPTAWPNTSSQVFNFGNPSGVQFGTWAATPGVQVWSEILTGMA